MVAVPRPQFRLRSLFIVTAIVAVGCWVGPPIWQQVGPMIFPPAPSPTPKTSFVPTNPFAQARTGVQIEDLRAVGEKQFKGQPEGE